MHLAMRYEDTQGRRKTAGSGWIRLAMQRFRCHDPKLGPAAWGHGYVGQTVVPTSAEDGLLDHIRAGTFPPGEF